MAGAQVAAILGDQVDLSTPGDPEEEEEEPPTTFPMPGDPGMAIPDGIPEARQQPDPEVGEMPMEADTDMDPDMDRQLPMHVEEGDQ